MDLGVSAPKLSNARVVNGGAGDPSQPVSLQALLTQNSLSLGTQMIEFDMTYTDTISMSLSTSYLFNYPMSSFARLPVSLTISLSLFESKVS